MLFLMGMLDSKMITKKKYGKVGHAHVCLCTCIMNYFPKKDMIMIMLA